MIQLFKAGRVEHMFILRGTANVCVPCKSPNPRLDPPEGRATLLMDHIPTGGPGRRGRADGAAGLRGVSARRCPRRR